MRAYLSAGLMGTSAAALVAGWLIEGPRGFGAPGDATPPKPTQASTGAERPTTVQEIQVAVAREVPGFGGLYVDPEAPDRLKVWLVDPESELQPVRESLSRLIGAYPAFDADKIDVQQGQYGFLQLQEWHNRLFQQISLISTVVTMDVQEAINKVEIGVQDQATQDAARRDAEDLGIPADALNVTIASSPKQDGELQNYHRPLVGGQKISNPTGHNIGPFVYESICSLGVPARRGGLNGTPGVLTASHCSNTYLGPDTAQFYQPYYNGLEISERFGSEALDPTPFPGTGAMCDVYGQCCPVGNSCRFSDATWIQLEPEDATGDGVGQGRIARPSSGTNWDGYSFFVIDGVQGPYVGEPITKVGQTTGRTDGYITGTNVHVRSFASDQIWLLYQHRASYRTSPGDSGGPVFHVTNNGLDVYLEGINWGHFGDNEYDAIFSDAQYINLSQDIGANLYYALPPGGGGSK